MVIAVFEKSQFAVVARLNQSSFEDFIGAKRVVAKNSRFAIEATLLILQKAVGLAIAKSECGLMNYTLFFLFKAAFECFSDSLAIEC